MFILPLEIRFMRTSSASLSNRFAKSNTALISPMPSNLPTKRVGEKVSRSSIRSPVPMYITCAPVAADAAKAPPPFAELSSFVIIIPPTGTTLWNASACA